MSQRSIHSFSSTSSSRSVEVPFSWEAKPGISKLDHHQMITTTTTTPSHEEEEKIMKGYINIDGKLMISPPPFRCPESPKVSGTHGLCNIPLPPCLFQSSPVPPMSNSSRVCVMRREEDPFLAAYLECCTKSTSVKKELSKRGRRKRRGGGGFINGLSCKNIAGGVREDAIANSG